MERILEEHANDLPIQRRYPTGIGNNNALPIQDLNRARLPAGLGNPPRAGGWMASLPHLHLHAELQPDAIRGYSIAAALRAAARLLVPESEVEVMDAVESYSVV